MNKPFKQDWRYAQANRRSPADAGGLRPVLRLVVRVRLRLGGGDPEGYDYIFGLPAWFFLSCIAGYPLLSALLWFMVRRFFKDIPLDEEGGAPKREGLEVTDERHPEAF